MAEKKLYGATFGPYLYDDTDTIDDEDSEFPSMTYDASVTNGLHLCAGIRFLDTNQSNHLTVTWNENDTVNRTLQITVNAGNRVLALHGNLTVESASLVNQDLTTDATVTFAKLILSAVVNAAADVDKFLVLDGSGNVDFRTGAEVLSDIGGATGFAVAAVLGTL